MTKSFINTTYRKHRTDCLESEATAAFPLLQLDIQKNNKLKEMDKEIQEIRNEIKNLKKKLETKLIERSNFAHGQSSSDDEKTLHGIMFPCPLPDCRGILDTKGICRICNTDCCKKCHKIVHEGECKQDDLENVRLIRQNTKSCPKCQNGIFKTEGCDQMWCTICHTCFSWRTGNILNGTIHNPHFYEFVRNNGTLRRNAGDIPCGGMPEIVDLLRFMNNRVFNPVQKEYITNLHRLNSHIQHVEMPYYMRMITNTNEKKRIAGINYLCNLMDKTKWKNYLYLLHKREEKNRQYHQLMETFSFNINEMYRQFHNENITTEEFIKSTETLTACVNQGIKDLNKSYGAKIRIITVE